MIGEGINDWFLCRQGISQLVMFGAQPVQFSRAARYYAEAAKGGPEWGLRFSVTLLFPK
jgi:hypothetical protein